MANKMKSKFIFNKDLSKAFDELKASLMKFKKEQDSKFKKNIKEFKLDYSGDTLFLDMISDQGYPHSFLFQIRNLILKEFGRKYSLRVKNVIIYDYEIRFPLDNPPLTEVLIPYVEDIKFIENECIIKFSNLDDETFIKQNYINRIVKRIKEKVDQQHYGGKGEYMEILWSSKVKKEVWNKDPSKVMLDKGWIAQTKVKGKWFFGPQLVKIFRAMEQIVETEIIEPLGFIEVIEPHHESFNTLLKTGHLEGVPMELYYICEPKTRNTEDWENFIDHLKISKKVPTKELQKMLSPPNAINCYVQCPNIYEFFAGKTIADSEFPILIYDKAAISNRYESGGRHGIERMDEFHRIELVFIGTKEQLIEIKDKIIEKYKKIFNKILDLEWRMAWVTPFYLQHSGVLGLDDEKQRLKGTIDFESYLPYRGSREKSEWLEFQNFSIIGKKYIDAFNIKAQKLDLWSGCSGIGIERWIITFLAQKGINPDNWPSKFRDLVGEIPKTFTFY